MDERERIRREWEEDERLDAADPLRHLLRAGDDEDNSGGGGGAKEDEHGEETADKTRLANGQLRYKLNEGNTLVPAQRAAIEGDTRAVVRYFTSTSHARPPITFGLSRPPVPTTSAEKGYVDVHLQQDVANGCGGRIWPAAEVLGAYLARSAERWAERWAGKDVLELGAGTGLLGLLCARMGVGGTVWITDQDAMMALMQRNLELNEEVARAEDGSGTGLPSPCVVKELNWGEPIPEDVPSKPEVLLLADCVYLEIAFQPLVDTMVELSTPSTEILFCYQKRRKADKRFFALLKRHFHFEHVEDDDPDRRTVYNREGTQLLRVVKKK
ncbi:unnamed protein product [Tilletia controversa]|uniref:Protein-lysine N-methyltransferase EFM6 n=1 Tax=Tilletia controversa TaxID=13291 RepID=A0A8X7N0J0_9BASI|nr:hypothetical protein A4X06_0g933 [Tilletia controversa]CAD6928962.1 unnamed protein product [Tilletia controversa]CAD6935485.1 unnamed protein product [Tilletia controversa]CAD6946832.1 unnamed protein product [Tilletia controversa]CAD6974780.1 unnamed protein product [Tilletia controversa]